jgi:magnesium chelatase subunit D
MTLKEPGGTERASAVWSDAMLAAALFAVDPVGLGGVVVRSGPGPARDRWLATVQSLLPAGAPVRRVPVRIEDDRLLGGLDLSASLTAGRPIVERGVLAACDGGVAILAMAERMEDAAGARLSAVLDSGEVVIERDGLATRLPARIGLIALDEGREPDERLPDALLERLAFRIDLNEVAARNLPEGAYGPVALAEARRRLATVPPASDAIVEALCTAAEMFGLLSIRPPLLALRAARAHAALAGRTEIAAEDAAAAARLVLAPRALTAPAEAAADEAEDDADPPPEQPSDPGESDSETPEEAQPPDAEMVIEAIQAALPEGLLDQVNLDGQRPARSTRGQGSGAAMKSVQRGRPVGSRHGALRGGDRLNLPETLRAATPWQKLRAGGPTNALIQVRQEDFRIRRFVQRQEATTIFLVDASGSAAFQRLAEAKGAVELLLAKAYVSRTRVALIAFRNTGAELLLAPTRSLTRAKRSLADLPGGGGTPLALGLDAALLLAQAEKAKDRTPLIVILTDGRTNIGRSGAPGRAAAESDALAAARGVREAAVGAVFIDTSPRAQPDGDRFAKAMGAVYAPLPYVDAGAVSGLVDGLRTARR